jgi:hypothetical protein
MLNSFRQETASKNFIIRPSLHTVSYGAVRSTNTAPLQSLIDVENQLAQFSCGVDENQLD